MKVKIGLLKVLTLESGGPGPHDALLENHFPGLKVISRCIADQPEGIYDERTERIAVPKIVELGKQLEKEDVKAIIVDCASDPGVKELREVLKIPVIGAGSSAASLALTIGNKVGTLGIRGNAPRVMQQVLGKHLIIAAKPKGIRTACDLFKEEVRENSMIAAERLIEKRVDVICLACTGYSRLDIAGELEKRTGVPVIDALVAAGLFAWYWTNTYNSLFNREVAHA